MNKVTVNFKKGEPRIFKQSRSGGSYSNSVRYEGVFVIVTDVWGTECAFPAADVAEVNFSPESRGRW